ncbi:MAG TPA: hypothetical protein VNI83_02525, partial [Vicinamibacterales bacterium]|nr:hypothetical protein [Vicinamibacterales bacterium]
MSTAISLTLRALLRAAADRARGGPLASHYGGLTPAAQALLVAGTRTDLSLLVVPTDADIEAAAADLRFFLAAIEGWSEADADRLVLPFPSPEVDPYRGPAPHLEVASARARALHALASLRPRAVVASAAALLPRLPAPDDLARLGIELAPGVEVSPLELADRLAEGGYAREDPVDQHGEFSVRGGIVDVFPAGEAQPIRIEFVGDLVESLRRYDPATQRSVAPLDRVLIAPLREPAWTDASALRPATVADYLARHRAVVFLSSPSEVEAQAA